MDFSWARNGTLHGASIFLSLALISSLAFLSLSIFFLSLSPSPPLHVLFLITIRYFGARDCFVWTLRPSPDHFMWTPGHQNDRMQYVSDDGLSLGAGYVFVSLLSFLLLFSFTFLALLLLFLSLQDILVLPAVFALSFPLSPSAPPPLSPLPSHYLLFLLFSFPFLQTPSYSATWWSHCDQPCLPYLPKSSSRYYSSYSSFLSSCANIFSLCIFLFISFLFLSSFLLCFLGLMSNFGSLCVEVYSISWSLVVLKIELVN